MAAHAMDVRTGWTGTRAGTSISALPALIGQKLSRFALTLVEAIEHDPERLNGEIGALIAKTGGRLTDDLERRIAESVMPSGGLSR